VLIYWMTTNLWSMGQQHFIIKRMPPLNIGGKGAPAPAAASSGGGLTSLLKGKQPPPEPESGPTRLTQVRQPPGGKAGKQSTGSDAAGDDSAPTLGKGTSAAGSSGGAAGGGAGAGAGGGSGRNVKPAKAASRPSGRPGAKKRTGKGGSRRGGRR
jgi:YidC/Oxa1 family membrane protein insertase